MSKKIITISLEDFLVDFLDSHSTDLGTSRSWLVENIIFSAFIHSHASEVSENENE